MTPFKQLYRHRPEDGVWGDCFRTALGCLLDVPPDSVPHEHRDMSGDEQNALIETWLRERGLSLITFAYYGPGSDVSEPMSKDDVLNHVAHFHRGLNHLFSGRSPRGFDHVVVAADGKIVWDPHPDDAGIVAPCGDNLWWVNFVGRLV